MSNKPTRAEPAQTKATEQKRIYKGQQEIDHDLFKLEPCTMLKNVSYTETPIYERFEHCHIFHTVDSSGTKQTTSSAQGGHFHVMSVTQGENGVPQVQCSKPMRYVQKRINGRMQKVTEELGDDQHVHSVEYLGSERITVRQINPDFAKFQAQMAAKEPSPIPGIEG